MSTASVLTLTNELCGAAATFQILSIRSFHFLGRQHDVSDVRAPEPGFLLNAAARSLLSEILYETLHCRQALEWSPTPCDWAARRDFVAALSASNNGQDTWEAGWTVRGLEADGWMLVEKYGTRFRVRPGRFRAVDSPIQIGAKGFVRVPGERCNMLPGFYMAFGEAQLHGDDTGMVRIYWHLWSGGAAPLTSALTTDLNRVSVPFELKLLSEPSEYPRSDAAVLYLHRDLYTQVIPQLRHVHGKLRRWLRSSVSAFAKRIAPGVGLAEDSGDGSSFGQNRAALVASYLASEEILNSSGTREISEVLLDQFGRAGWDLNRFHLSQGSIDRYPEFAH